jgi:hypothetical protein
MLNETNSVFVAAMSSRRIFAKRLNGGSRDVEAG